MNSSKLTVLCKSHLVSHKKKVGRGALSKLSRLLMVDVGTLRGICSGSNLNATGKTIEKILEFFNDPLYIKICEILTTKKLAS